MKNKDDKLLWVILGLGYMLNIIIVLALNEVMIIPKIVFATLMLGLNYFILGMPLYLKIWVRDKKQEGNQRRKWKLKQNGE